MSRFRMSSTSFLVLATHLASGVKWTALFLFGIDLWIGMGFQTGVKVTSLVFKRYKVKSKPRAGKTATVTRIIMCSYWVSCFALTATFPTGHSFHDTWIPWGMEVGFPILIFYLIAMPLWRLISVFYFLQPWGSRKVAKLRGITPEPAPVYLSEAQRRRFEYRAVTTHVSKSLPRVLSAFASLVFYGFAVIGAVGLLSGFMSAWIAVGLIVAFVVVPSAHGVGKRIE